MDALKLDSQYYAIRQKKYSIVTGYSYAKLLQVLLSLWNNGLFVFHRVTTLIARAT